MIGTVRRGSDFNGVVGYVLKREEATLLHSNIQGALSQPPSVAASQMQAAATLNQRVKRPVYHLSVSPAASEVEALSPSRWMVLGDRLLEELGLENHQFLMALHHDTTYPNTEQVRTHAHLVINLVGSDGKAADTRWDYYRIPEALRTLEQEFELESPFEVQRQPPAAKTPDTRGQRQRYQRELAEYQNPEHPRDEPPQVSYRTQLQSLIDQSLAQSIDWLSFQQYLEAEGVGVHCTDQGWFLEKDEVYFAGCQLGRRYTYASIIDQLERSPMAEVQVTQKNSQPLNPRWAVESSPFGLEQPSIGTALAAIAQDQSQPTPTSSEQSVPSSSDVPPTPINEHLADGVDGVADSVDWAAQFTEGEATPYVDGLFLGAKAGEAIATGLKGVAEGLRSMPSASEPPPPGEWVEPDGPAIEGAVQPALSAADETMAAEILTDHDLPSRDAPALAPHHYDAAELAQTLHDFVQTRAIAHQLPVEQPVPTSNGLIQVQGNHLSIVGQIESETEVSRAGWVSGGTAPVFEATQSEDGQWQVSLNRLPDERQERIAQLPTSAEEYRGYQDASLFIHHLRHQAEQSGTSLSELEGFEWQEQSGAFHYSFDIAPNRDDGSLHITGETQHGESIFDVTLRADDTFAVRHSDLSEQAMGQLRSLSAERERPTRGATQQLERSTSKSSFER